MDVKTMLNNISVLRGKYKKLLDDNSGINLKSFRIENESNIQKKKVKRMFAEIRSSAADISSYAINLKDARWYYNDWIDMYVDQYFRVCKKLCFAYRYFINSIQSSYVDSVITVVIPEYYTKYKLEANKVKRYFKTFDMSFTTYDELCVKLDELYNKVITLRDCYNAVRGYFIILESVTSRKTLLYIVSLLVSGVISGIIALMLNDLIKLIVGNLPITTFLSLW